eukprot:COSAG06_NODE_1303_length_9931_cov_69.878255_2_plen_253_part_00
MRYQLDLRVGEGGGGRICQVGDPDRRNDEPTCRCAGLANSYGAGADCTMVDDHGDLPITNSIYGDLDCKDVSGISIGGCLYCYVRPGVCSDEVTTDIMPTLRKSVLACAGVTAQLPMCDGITSTSLYILPPGATDSGQAIAEVTVRIVDAGIAFTATATGTFNVKVESSEGTGNVTVSGREIGTALERSPPLVADGTPHPLTVSCELNRCAFGYDGATAYDGDGSGFDLLMPDAQARSFFSHFHRNLAGIFL